MSKKLAQMVADFLDQKIHEDVQDSLTPDKTMHDWLFDDYVQVMKAIADDAKRTCEDKRDELAALTSEYATIGQWKVEDGTFGAHIEQMKRTPGLLRGVAGERQSEARELLEEIREEHKTYVEVNANLTRYPEFLSALSALRDGAPPTKDQYFIINHMANGNAGANHNHALYDPGPDFESKEEICPSMTIPDEESEKVRPFLVELTAKIEQELNKQREQLKKPASGPKAARENREPPGDGYYIG